MCENCNNQKAFLCSYLPWFSYCAPGYQDISLHKRKHSARVAAWRSSVHLHSHIDLRDWPHGLPHWPFRPCSLHHKNYSREFAPLPWWHGRPNWQIAVSGIRHVPITRSTRRRNDSDLRSVTCKASHPQAPSQVKIASTSVTNAVQFHQSRTGAAR